MKIKHTVIPPDPCTIEQFAEAHDLVMRINEQQRFYGADSRFTARFEDADIKDGPILTAMYGYGPTEADAIKNYAREISGKALVIDAMGPKRRVLQVPEFKPAIFHKESAS